MGDDTTAEELAKDRWQIYPVRNPISDEQLIKTVGGHPAYFCCCCGRQESDDLKVAGWAKGNVVTCMCQSCAENVIACCKEQASRSDG